MQKAPRPLAYNVSLALLVAVLASRDSGATAPAVSDPLPVSHGLRYGYIDRTGRVVIKPRFKIAGSFHEGLAAVRIGKAWGYIEPSGRLVIRAKFDDAWGFSEGLARVKIAGKFGFVNREGSIIIPARFDDARGFAEGLAIVAVKSKEGFIDRTGRAVIPPRFDDVGSFSQGLAQAEIRKKHGYIGRNGEFVIPPRFTGSGAFAEGMACVQYKGKWGFIGPDGGFRIAPRFAGADGFSDGLAPVKLDGRWGYIDRTGRISIPPRFDGAAAFHEGLAAVESGEKWGYVDKAGRMVVPAQFFWAEEFSGGVARVHVGLLIGYVTPSGAWLFDPMRRPLRECLIGLLLLVVLTLWPGLATRLFVRRTLARIRHATRQEQVAALYRLQRLVEAMVWIFYATWGLGVGLALAWHFDAVYTFGYLVYSRLQFLGRLAPAGGTAIVLAAVMITLFAGIIHVQTAAYEVDKVVRRTTWSFRQFAWAQSRIMLIAIVPSLLWMVFAIALRPSTYVLYGSLVVFLLAVQTFYPLILRYIWRAGPLTDASLARTLSALCRKARVRFSGIYVWETSSARLANAMVSGIFPFCRFIYLTDHLIKRLTRDEIVAILAHEIGHIRKRHLWGYLGFTLLYAALTKGIFMLADYAHLDRYLPDFTPIVFGSVWMILYFVVLFGLLSRRFERQADRYAVELTGNSRAFISAMRKLARVNYQPRRWTRFHGLVQTHPSFDQRIEAIKASTRPRAAG